MKKVLLTAAFAFTTMFASAQFMVVTTYDDDQEEHVLAEFRDFLDDVKPDDFLGEAP